MADGDGSQNFVTAINARPNLDHKNDYETDQGEGESPNVNPQCRGEVPEAESHPKKQKYSTEQSKSHSSTVNHVSTPDIFRPHHSKFRAQADIAHPRSRKPAGRPLPDDYLDESISAIRREDELKEREKRPRQSQNKIIRQDFAQNGSSDIGVDRTYLPSALLTDHDASRADFRAANVSEQRGSTVKFGTNQIIDISRGLFDGN
mmetsp:Transcript_13178/g.17907  ORF Transcript_13178/g.17907 Transcript_13178/m.17907 type:complete len:204 (-) Transcript_13178:302-913(-)